MNAWQTIRIATRSIWRNRLRSFLTTLGVIIGVGAVIAMVAIGEGAKAQVEQSFAAMGSNLLIVVPGSTTRGGSMGGFGSMPTLTWDDLRAIRSELSGVRAAAALLRQNGPVLSEDQNWTTSINGTSPEYFDVRDWRVARGSLFSAADVDGGSKVAVLGQTVVTKLYGAGADPVGQTIRVRNIPFEVIGVLSPKGQSAFGQDLDDALFVPQSTFQTKIQGGLQKFLQGMIFVAARPEVGTQGAERQLTALLRDRHRLAPDADDDFSVRNMAEMASAQQQGTETMTTLLASVAAVSLLVGGIGIMNIMLVSVTERTREIGLRMAVGAKRRTILAQFLIEALTLSVIGGLIGVALGLFTAERLATQFGWPMLIQPSVILTAFGFSALVGVGFGLYPARKASQLDPIEALRYE